MARTSRKKSWQTGRERVSFVAALAIQRENVVNRLVRLRTEIGHPEKAGEPLPQDQAAARAGVTARQWQRWESGDSVPYARNLSAVADAFDFDVSEFYDGPAGKEPAPTPTPFGQDTASDHLDAIRRELAELAAQNRELLAQHDKILTMLVDGQDVIDRLDRLEQAVTKRVDASAKRLEESVAEARSILRAASPDPKPTASKRAPKRTRAASPPTQR